MWFHARSRVVRLTRRDKVPGSLPPMWLRSSRRETRRDSAPMSSGRGPGGDERHRVGHYPTGPGSLRRKSGSRGVASRGNLPSFRQCHRGLDAVYTATRCMASALPEFVAKGPGITRRVDSSAKEHWLRVSLLTFYRFVARAILQDIDTEAGGQRKNEKCGHWNTLCRVRGHFKLETSPTPRLHFLSAYFSGDPLVDAILK